MEIPEIFKTDDHSNTLFSERYGEHYHSIHGAKNESEHIFINAGLKSFNKSKISIFEMGLGTALNAYLTLLYAEQKKIKVEYSCIEKHVLSEDTYSSLEYGDEKDRSKFLAIHTAAWNEWQEITENFSIKKVDVDLIAYQHTEMYDLVYFDAFSPDSQPELWTEQVFENLYQHMNSGGVLMTYSVKGVVKRALKSVGFRIEKLPGPIGKREILRAIKD